MRGFHLAPPITSTRAFLMSATKGDAGAYVRRFTSEGAAGIYAKGTHAAVRQRHRLRKANSDRDATRATLRGSYVNSATASHTSTQRAHARTI